MKAEIYTKPTCPWCVRAKQILQNNNYEIQEKVLGVDATKEDIEARLNGKKISTVPQIFLDGEYVGGCTDLAKKLGVNLGC